MRSPIVSALPWQTCDGANPDQVGLKEGRGARDLRAGGIELESHCGRKTPLQATEATQRTPTWWFTPEGRNSATRSTTFSGIVAYDRNIEVPQASRTTKAITSTPEISQIE